MKPWQKHPKLIQCAWLAFLCGFALPLHAEPKTVPPIQTIGIAGLTDNIPQLLLDTVNKKIAGEILAQRFDYDAPSTVTLYGVKVKAPGGELVVDVRKLRVSVSVKELFSGELRFEEITIDEPTLNLGIQSGKLNLQRAFTPKRKKSGADSDDGEPLNITIDNLRINKGDVRFKNDAGLSLQFARINTQGTLELSGENLIVALNKMAFRSGRFENETLAMNLGNTQLTNTQLVGSLIRFDSLSTETLGGNLNLKGKINRDGAGSLKLSGSYNFPKNAWPEKLAPLDFATPKVNGWVNINGNFDSPTIQLNTNFGPVEAYDYALASGSAKVNVGANLVQVTELDAQLLAGGTIKGSINYEMNQKQVTLDNQLSAIPLRALVPGTNLARKLKGSVRGKINASVDLKGEAPVIEASYQLTTRNFVMAPLQLPAISRLKGKMVLNGKALSLRQNKITAEDLAFSFNGRINLQRETLNLNTELESSRIKELVDSLPEDMVLGNTKTTGTVTGTFDDYLYSGDVHVAAVEYSGLPVSEITTSVTVSPSQVHMPELTAELAGGMCNLNLTIDLSDEILIGLAGQGELREIQLASLEMVQPEQNPLTGAVSAAFQIGGTTETPEVVFQVHGEDIHTEGILKSEMDLQGELQYPRVLLNRLTVVSSNLNVSGESIELDLDQMNIAGLISINHVDVESFASAQEIPAKGQVAGWLKIHENIKHPQLEAGLFLSDLVYDERALGDGKVRVVATPQQSEATDYEVAANGLITSSQGSVFFQSYLSTLTDEVLAQIRLQDLDLQHYGGGWSESIPPMDGTLQGKARIKGTTSDPKIHLNLSVAQLGLILEEQSQPQFDDEEENGPSPLSPFKYLGSVRVAGEIQNGLVDAQVCAFPNFSASSRTRGIACSKKERLQIRVQGNIDAESTSNLTAQVEMDFASMADYIPSVARAEIQAGMHLTSTISLARDNSEAEWDISGSGRFIEFDFASPQAPRFDLKQPFAIQFTGESARLNTPVELITESGQLTISGFYAPEEMKLDAQGQLALAFLGLFTDSVTQSEGLLDVKIQARGTADQPQLEGLIKPQPGAFVHLTSLDQDLIFQSGALAFAQESPQAQENGETSEEQIRISFVELKTKTDNGDLALNGDVLLNPVSSDIFDTTPIDQWNLEVQASGLTYHSRTTHVECATQLKLQGEGKAPKLQGQLEITEGQLQKEFRLNNFVITAADDSPGTPLTETLYFMEDLEFDVGILIQSFGVQTLLNSFSLETDLQGSLRLAQNLREPLLTGSVELTEGQFVFPYAQFDLASATVDFKQTPGHFIDPQFRIEAWSEVSQRDIPQLNQETLPLVLVLEGNLDEMKLDFRAEDGSDYSRTDLLALVLLGYLPSLPGDSAGGGPSTDNALRAVSRELTASTRKQVEDLLRNKLGANVQVDLYADSSGVKTGVRWHLGKRLELEGAGGIQFGNDASAQNNDLRLRFLIFDHLPFGKELFLEGGLASPPSTNQNAEPRGDVRMTYRILEQ